MKESNYERAVCYERSVWTAGAYKDRIRHVLLDSDDGEFSSINDAIEAYQCKAAVDAMPGLFTESELDSILPHARLRFASAYRFVNYAIAQVELVYLYNEVEGQYSHCFWEFLVKSGASKRLSSAQVETLLNTHPELIGDVLGLQSLVNAHAEVIRASMLQNALSVAEPFIHRLATVEARDKNLVLPTCLENDDLDDIMRDYLNSSRPNPKSVDEATARLETLNRKRDRLLYQRKPRE